MWHDTLVGLAQSFREQHHILSFEVEAYEEYLAFSQCIINRCTEDLGGNSAVWGWARKSCEIAARLAGILTLLKNPGANQIALPEARAACRMINEYFIPHMKTAFGAGGRLSPEAESVLKAALDLDARMDGAVPESFQRRQPLCKNQSGTAGAGQEGLCPCCYSICREQGMTKTWRLGVASRPAKVAAKLIICGENMHKCKNYSKEQLSPGMPGFYCDISACRHRQTTQKKQHEVQSQSLMPGVLCSFC